MKPHPVELRPIPGWEGRYSATADGHIWSHARGRLMYEEWSHPEDPGRSHLRVRCNVGGSRCWRYVHMLVAEAWIGPRAPDMETCHIDGDRRNNTPENLYYGTRTENRRDRERHRAEREAQSESEPTWSPTVIDHDTPIWEAL